MKPTQEIINIAKQLHSLYWISPELKSALENDFLELKENEDESIRKEIIEYLTVTREKDLVGHPERQCWIAYLEKQKEQKPAKDTALQKAFISSKIDYTLEEKCDASDYAEAILPTSVTYGENEEEYKLHKIIEAAFIAGQKNEQKSTEWSEEDKKNRCPLKDDEIKVGDIITYFKDGKKGIMLVSSFDSGIYPRCKWGISHIDGTAYGDWAPGSGRYYAATEKEKQQLYDTMPKEIKGWLKSLRPQPKQEWNEDDENMLKTIFDSLETYAKNTLPCLKSVVEDEIAWLKSLRPQPHWKPSEEQMRCLLDCVSKAKEIHNASVGGYDAYRILMSLYDELHKLL